MLGVNHEPNMLSDINKMGNNSINNSQTVSSKSQPENDIFIEMMARQGPWRGWEPWGWQPQGSGVAALLPRCQGGDLETAEGKERDRSMH